MGIRVTVLIDDEIMAKLRNVQASMIKNSSKSVSFSSVLNQILEEGLRKNRT
jgi:hypothetical protein